MVLKPVDEAVLRRDLQSLREGGIESLAVCLLHAYRSAAHELIVERIALGSSASKRLAFRAVSLRS